MSSSSVKKERISDGLPHLPADSLQREREPADQVALRVALDNVVRENLSPIATGLAILYILLAAAHALVLPHEIAPIMIGSAAATSFLLLTINHLIRSRSYPSHLAHPIASIIAGLVLFNCLIHLYLQPQPEQTTNLLLFIIGVGSFFLSARWLTLIITITLLGWGAIVSRAAASPAWLHYGFAMMQTVLLSVLLYITRLRAFRRMEWLRQQDNLQKRELAAGLLATEQSYQAVENSKQELETALQTVKQREAHTRTIIDNMLSGLIIVDARGMIELVNPAATKIFGYADHEMIGQHLTLLVPEKQRSDAVKIFASAYQTSLNRISEWEGRRKNGETFPFELSLYRVDTQDGWRLAGNIQDVSERREVERLKKEFISTVSHELRTPLTAIRGSLNLLSGGVLGDLSEEALEVITIAERNSNRLITLINDILDLERLENGRLEMNFATIELQPVIDRALETVRAIAAQAAVTIVAPTVTEKVFADGDRLTQVLVNLLSNAIKFSPPNSTVTIATSENPGWVTVLIKDQGRGIPAAHMNTIFDRFKQVEASDDREKGGTGLGLAICKGIIEQHNGIIAAESEENHGSIFWFRVPSASQPQSKAKSPALTDKKPDKRPDLLLVDKDESFLRVMVRQFALAGIAVRTAASGNEAIRQAIAKPPALMVLDVDMPDGFYIIKRLGQQEKLQSLPLLIYTGLDLTSEQQGELRLGPTRFLTKSKVTDEEFRRLVIDMLQR